MPDLSPEIADTPKVVLETPVEWFENPADGLRHRVFFASLCGALARMNARVELCTVPLGADAAPRFAGEDEMIVSYHSHGSETGVLRVKESYVPPYYGFDYAGYSGFSELAQNPQAFLDEIEMFDLDEAVETADGILTKFVAENLSKYAQDSSKDEGLPQDYVFVPLQTVNDPIAGFWAFDQMDGLERLTGDAHHTNTSVVVKRHPLCTSPTVEARLQDLNAAHENLRLAQGSVHDLIASARSVMGGNSGVCFEALIHRKSVFTFGKSDFQIATTALGSLEDVSRTLSPPGDVSPDWAVRFVGWYLNEYCAHAEDISTIEKRLVAALEKFGGVPTKPVDQAAQLREGFAALERQRRRIFGR